MNNTELKTEVAALEKALEKSSPANLTNLRDTIQYLIRNLSIGSDDFYVFGPSMEEVLQARRKLAGEIGGYLESLGGVAEKCGKLEMVAVERQIERTKILRASLEEQQRLDRAQQSIRHEQDVDAAKRNAEIARYQAEEARYRQEILSAESADKAREIAEAKHRVELAKHEAEEAKYKRDIRDLQREPERPKSKEEIKEAKRQWYLEKLAELKRQEEQAILAITGNKTQCEWTDEMRDEVKVMQNMYASKHQRYIEEMEKVL